MSHSSLRPNGRTVATRLKRAREAKGLTQERLAEQLEMEVDTYRKKENGQNPLYLDEIRKLCDLLEAPSLFPWMEWEAAKLADKLLGRE